MFHIIRLRYTLPVASLCLLLSTPVAAAGFSALGQVFYQSDWIFAGARAEALGQADLALPRGPLSTLFNPAPLPDGQGVHVGYGHMDYVAGFACQQYGLAWENGPWRFSAVRSEFKAEDILVRTAYQPEGTGELFSSEQRQQVFAVSLDIAQLSYPDSPWNWTVGLSHRNYRSSIQEDVSRFDGIDFGSSARRFYQLNQAGLEASVSGVLRNIDKDKFTPESTHIGVALTMHLFNDDGLGYLSCSLMAAQEDGPKDPDFFGTSRFGLELTGLGILSLRMGHDSHAFGGTSQWGAGLTIPERWIHPFSLTVDYGSLDAWELSSDPDHAFEGFNVRGRLAL